MCQGSAWPGLGGGVFAAEEGLIEGVDAGVQAAFHGVDKEGLAAARAQGKMLGRPKGLPGKSKLDGKENDLREMLSKGVSLSSIAKILGVSRTAVYHFIETRKIAPG